MSDQLTVQPTEEPIADDVVADSDEFILHLTNFDGPFDLLLQLITKRRLDITEVALSQVTDEFIAHLKAQGGTWDLEVTSNFLVIAATLLDLKAARLIPAGEVDDPEDLALLEARDLLFARLLQYRAFKEVASWLGETLQDQGQRVARIAELEEQFAVLLPEIVLPPADRLARAAAKALTPQQLPEVSFAHLHAARVSVVEQAQLIVERLRSHQVLSFADLVADAPDKLTTVCRFLALLELYKGGSVALTQPDPLGKLMINFVAAAGADISISDEFDEIAEEKEND